MNRESGCRGLMYKRDFCSCCSVNRVHVQCLCPGLFHTTPKNREIDGMRDARCFLVATNSAIKAGGLK